MAKLAFNILAVVAGTASTLNAFEAQASLAVTIENTKSAVEATEEVGSKIFTTDNLSIKYQPVADWWTKIRDPITAPYQPILKPFNPALKQLGDETILPIQKSALQLRNELRDKVLGEAGISLGMAKMLLNTGDFLMDQTTGAVQILSGGLPAIRREAENRSKACFAKGPFACLQDIQNGYAAVSAAAACVSGGGMKICQEAVRLGQLPPAKADYVARTYDVISRYATNSSSNSSGSSPTPSDTNTSILGTSFVGGPVQAQPFPTFQNSTVSSSDSTSVSKFMPSPTSIADPNFVIKRLELEAKERREQQESDQRAAQQAQKNEMQTQLIGAGAQVLGGLIDRIFSRPQPAPQAPSKPAESVHQTVYAPQPGYAPQPTYAAQPGYAPQPTYAPQPGYAPQPTYAPQPGYAPQPAYAPQPGYAPQPTYAPQPGYAPQPAYAPQPGYAPQPTYAAQPGYAPQPTYAAQPGYAPQAAYVPQPADTTVQASLKQTISDPSPNLSSQQVSFQAKLGLIIDSTCRPGALVIKVVNGDRFCAFPKSPYAPGAYFFNGSTLVRLN